MAITISSEPTTSHKSVYSPFQIECTSDRDDTTSWSVTAVTNASGSVLLTIPSGATLTSGDTTLLSGFSSIPNTNYDVTATSGTKVTLDLDWSTAYSGDTGTAAKNNRSFRIKAEIYEGTVASGTLIGTTQAFSQSGTYKFIPNGILKTALDYKYLAYNSTVVQANETGAKQFQIKFTEMFDNAAGLRQSHETANSTASLINNATRQHWETQAMTAFISEDTSQLPLTNIPYDQTSPQTLPIPLYNEEYFTMEYLWDTTTTAKGKVNYYDTDGVFISTGTNTSVTTDSKRLSIRVINNSTVRAVSNIGYIGCFLTNASGVRISEATYFQVIQQNPSDCSTRIQFINRLGAMDSFTFKGFSDASDTASRVHFTKDRGIGFSPEDRGRTNLQVTAAREFTAWSDYLSDAEALWLGELLTTQSAWVFKDNQSLPIDILNDSQFVKSQEGIQLELKYRYSNNLIIQS